MFYDQPVTSLPLLVWARRHGLSRDTAYRRARAGELPFPVHKTETGRFLVDVPPEDCAGTCLEDVHIECLADALLAELARRGYRLDQLRLEEDNG